MNKNPFTPEEIELAVSVNQHGIPWQPKSGDWFINLSSLKVNYNGEYIQSVSLCLILDEDGRSISYYELMIDDEENGNRMKRTLSYKEKETFALLNWVPDVKDCISIIDKNDNYSFLKLEKNDSIFIVSVLNKKNKQVISEAGKTERIAFYRLFLSL
jgi:hypothetical protein